MFLRCAATSSALSEAMHMAAVLPLSHDSAEWRCAAQDARNYAALCYPRWAGFLPGMPRDTQSQQPCGLIATNDDGSAITVLFQSVNLYAHRLHLGFCCEKEPSVAECINAIVAMLVDEWGFSTLITRVPTSDPILPTLCRCGFLVDATLRQHMRYQCRYHDVSLLSLNRP